MIKLPINLGRRGRLAVKIGGFILLGLVSFVFALQLTFNYDQVKQKFLVEALKSSYEVNVGAVKRGIMPGKFSLEKVTLRSRITKADEIPTVLYFEKIDANVGILGLIRGVISVDFEASIGGGTLVGSVEFPMKGGSFSLTASGHGIKGDAVPQLREAIGLPLLGKLDLGFAFHLGQNDWRKATGFLSLACPKGCTLGDGQTKFKPKVKSQSRATMMGEGIEWGRVEIDKLSAKAELKGGKLEVTKWEFDSRDAELHVELSMKLAKKFKESEFTTGCFRFQATPALQAREAKTATAISMIGGLRGPDGLFHVKLEGNYATVKARGRVCSGAGSDDEPAGTGKTGGPVLSTTGDKPIGGATEPPQVGDINPVPTFADAAPAPADAEGTGAGSAGSGSATTGTPTTGGAAPTPTLSPAGMSPTITPENSRTRQDPVEPPTTVAPPEPPPEPPPAVAPKGSD